MKSSIRGFVWLAVVVVMGFVSCTFAQDENNITVDLTSAGNFVYDGVYVSPYYATVNGATNTQVICDDFADESQVNQPWNANVTSFANLSSELGRTLWGSWYSSAAGGNVSSSTIIGWYEQAASLTLGLLQQTPGSLSEANYSYAVWAVFDPSGVISWLNAHGDTNACNAIFGAGNNCLSTKITGGLLAMAFNTSLGFYSNFQIITPLASNGQICTPNMLGSGNCPAQEFFMLVPEGGTAIMYLLLAMISCIGAVLMRSRGQRAGAKLV